MNDELAELAADEIRAAQAARLVGLVDIAPDLGQNEFARKDAAIVFPGVSKNKLERELDILVAAGVLGKAPRNDPRTGRQVVGYWFVE